MRILIFLCTYNERDNIELLCRRISEYCTNANILILDDGSPDGTGDVADAIARANLRVRVAHRPHKTGLGRAMAAGFEYAIQNNYDICITIDSDLSHDPADLPRLLKALESADVAIGSRHVPGGKIIGWSAWRQFNHWAANQLARWMVNIHTKDATNGYKAYRTSVLKTVPYAKIMDCGFVGHTLLVAALERKGYRIVEIPTTFTDRRAGHSKMNWDERIGGMRAMRRFNREYR